MNQGIYITVNLGRCRPVNCWYFTAVTMPGGAPRSMKTRLKPDVLLQRGYFQTRGAENAEETWNLCELRVSAVRTANNTQQGDHRTTKGAKSREKHESGRCFRAFRAISWYSWSESCPLNEISPLSTQELGGHPPGGDTLLAVPGARTEGERRLCQRCA